ncbi:hypothetical protein FBD94_10080 [Pedobacter hiemivivus]|uniref:Substrate import-associated zinc metallohydrolase lipoprotein n=1 Tax=Pedobacter hiemivivus TaxID=2530454 RepID=A0A4U1GHW5_9SPHI|nr:putative zinc-binding metallopeptidase [Pedobacter hiemivivus]TCC88987.1 hypothetical protein EZ444_21215 [Pedobacter hiemivivus]TKC62550.1 hypothetical protein FBD94_10080 [Pedobacter hiemivivus]
MKRLINYIAILCLALASCKKDGPLNANMDNFNIDSFKSGPTDDWLKREYLDPFNIEVLYRWDRYQVSLAKDLVPPLESKVIPAMETVKSIWLSPYLTVAGKEFIKPYVPKQIVLIGSAEYNNDGTITLGTADAGRRINLFIINSFQKSNTANVEQMMHTIHHEFGHILHQNSPIPEDFPRISPEYAANWTANVNTANEAKRLGFVSRYSRSNDNEDFVEMIAFLLVEGQDWFDAYVNTAGDLGKPRLRQKEQMIVNYFKMAYNINFRKLQAEVKASFDRETGRTTTFASNLARNTYSKMTVAKSDISQSATFTTAYTAAAVAVKAASAALTVADQFELRFGMLVGKPIATLVMTVKNGSTNEEWFFNYKVTVVGDKVTFVPDNTITGVETDKGTKYRPQLKPLLDIIEQASIASFLSPENLTKGGFKGEVNTANYFYGSLIR